MTTLTSNEFHWQYYQYIRYICIQNLEKIILNGQGIKKKWQVFSRHIHVSTKKAYEILGLHARGILAMFPFRTLRLFRIKLHVAYQTLQQDFMKTRYLGYISRTIAIIKFSCNISLDEQLMVSNKTNFQ